MALDFYEVLLEVEEEFDVVIQDADWPAAVSIGDLYSVVLSAVRTQHGERFADDTASYREVWDHLAALLVRELGLKREQIVPSARFFHELGFR